MLQGQSEVITRSIRRFVYCIDEGMSSSKHLIVFDIGPRFLIVPKEAQSDVFDPGLGNKMLSLGRVFR